MFHGRPYGIRAGPTMEEGNSANASQLRSLTIDFTLIYFIFYYILNVIAFHFTIVLLKPLEELYIDRIYQNYFFPLSDEMIHFK